MERRKVSAVYSEFTKKIHQLIRLDQKNQEMYSNRARHSLTKSQMIIVTEGVFVNAFSQFERFLEETFILYTRQRPTRSGTKVSSFITPKDGRHAREILKSSMPFLEWNDPEKLIRRCEIYLGRDDPIKISISTSRTRLANMKKVRNAIAHSSPEAEKSYASAVRAELRIAPLQRLQPGEFLLLTDPNSSSEHFLLVYMNHLLEIADIATA